MFRKIQVLSNYSKSLDNNSYWEKVKRAVRMRDDYTCQKCRTKGRHEVHHKKYVVNGKSIVGHELEYLNELVLLCGVCHKAEHKKNR